MDAVRRMHPSQRCVVPTTRLVRRAQALQSQLFNIVSYGLFCLGIYLVRERYLHASWRWMLGLTTVTYL